MFAAFVKLVVVITSSVQKTLLIPYYVSITVLGIAIRDINKIVKNFPSWIWQLRKDFFYFSYGNYCHWIRWNLAEDICLLSRFRVYFLIRPSNSIDFFHKRYTLKMLLNVSLLVFYLSSLKFSLNTYSLINYILTILSL